MYYYSDKKLHKDIEKLPIEIQNVVKSIEVAVNLNDICAKQDITLGETGLIYEKTTSVILGETRIENFVEKVREVLEDENKEKANEIASEINAKILTPIRNALKGEVMGNLVPSPFEENGKAPVPSYAQVPEKPKIEYVPEQKIEEKPKPIADEHGPYDKDHLLREIENPTPYEITTAIQRTLSAESPEFKEGRLVTENQKGAVPPNLPVKEKTAMESEVEKNLKMITGESDVQIKPTEAPILRTMSRDMASAQGKESGVSTVPNLPNRGKFGMGQRPPIRHIIPPPSIQTPVEKEKVVPEIPIPPQPPTPQIEKAVPNIPPPTPQKPPEKTEVVQNMIEDRLTKTVSIPSQKRVYNVDPYREPLE